MLFIGDSVSWLFFYLMRSKLLDPVFVSIYIQVSNTSLTTHKCFLEKNKIQNNFPLAYFFLLKLMDLKILYRDRLLQFLSFHLTNFFRTFTLNHSSHTHHTCVPRQKIILFAIQSFQYFLIKILFQHLIISQGVYEQLCPFFRRI